MANVIAIWCVCFLVPWVGVAVSYLPIGPSNLEGPAIAALAVCSAIVAIAALVLYAIGVRPRHETDDQQRT